MTENIQSDLAHLRTLAESGRRLPLVGGRYMILWGCVIALATLLQGAISVRILPLPSMTIAVVWFGLALIAVIIGRTTLVRRANPGQALTVNHRIERSTWQTAGMLLGLIALSILLVAEFHSGSVGDYSFYQMFIMMPPITFAIYALVLRVVAESSSQDILKPYSWLAFAFVPITIAIAMTGWQFAVTAIGIMLVSALPGFKLLAAEKAHSNG